MLVVVDAQAAPEVQDGADVWYKFVPDAANDYTLSLPQYFPGATLAVFKGNAIVNDRTVAQPEPGLHEEYSEPFWLALEAGETYYFRVAGIWQGDAFATGNFEILLETIIKPEGEGEIVPSMSLLPLPFWR